MKINRLLDRKASRRLYHLRRGSMEQQAISKVCLLAGKIMLESGEETYRVEDTMMRIAQAFGMDNAQSHATPSAITFAIDMTEQVHFVRIDERVNDIYKVSRVISIFRPFY